jgi:tetratricopeptide (TPR) repeat protein
MSYSLQSNDRQRSIFISYSHRGNGPEWKSALLRALHVFEQHHLLDVWQDGKIRDSSFWDDDIKQAMRSARLAVVLITPEALKSQYILEDEFPFLRDCQQHENLPIFPVICEPCEWKSHEWLRATQAPNNSNPLSELSPAAQEQIFRKLATDIAEELSRVALTKLSRPEQAPTPATVYLDKFPLSKVGGQPEKLIGREQELALLDLAFSQPHTAIVSLVAWGGVGKTMLVQHWLQDLQREDWHGVKRIYAWSFYSQGTKEDRQASEDSFLAHALEWFGVQCEPTVSPWDKGRLLADAVVRERTLLILDGIEPLQYPPGPMGGQLRAPGVQSLLRKMARQADVSSEHLGLCLVTTREPLTDLTDFQRRPDSAWGSVLRLDLGNLNNEAGAALLHHAGAKRAGAVEIKTDDTELISANREVAGHALTLNLLGRFLSRAHNGDIRKRDLVKFEEADRNVQGGTTFKMLAAFENWFSIEGDIELRALTILRLLGLFDRPADAGCMAELRKPPVIIGLTEPLFTLKRDSSSSQITEQPLSDKAWNDATHFLSDFGLVVIQTDADKLELLLDCHPLIREHFAKQLFMNNDRVWHEAHIRLYEYLKNSVIYQPDTLQDLESLYQALTHGCLSGFYEDVRKTILDDRIRRGEELYSVKGLGLIGTHLAGVACFFKVPWSQLMPTISLMGQSWLYNEAAFCLRAVGRLEEAIEPMKYGADAAIRCEVWNEAGKFTSNLSELKQILGKIDEAVHDATQSVVLSDQSFDWRARRRDRAILANSLHYAGKHLDSCVLFSEAESIQMKNQPYYPQLFSVGGFRYWEFMLSDAECTSWQIVLNPKLEYSIRHRKAFNYCNDVSLRAHRVLSWYKSGGWGAILDYGFAFETIGRVTLLQTLLQTVRSSLTPSNSSDLPTAKEYVQSALDAVRRSGATHHIPRTLILQSWLHFLVGDKVTALSDINEAWDIAERGPRRLHMADIHLYRARLFFREKHYPWKSPQEDLAAAEKLINECGYHRRDEELNDAKRAILGRAIGQPYPVLQTCVDNYADCLDKLGYNQEQIMAALRELSPDFFDEKTPENEDHQKYTPDQVRGIALELYNNGEYDKARELLKILLKDGFEVLSTRLHLARLALITDNYADARQHVTDAWACHTAAKPYVIARILWMQILIALIDNADAIHILGQLKTALLAEDVNMEWTMQPVLDHLKPRLSDNSHALLTALVAALSDRAYVEKLDAFSLWRDTAPQPLE